MHRSVFILPLIAILLAGCGGRFPSERVPNMKILILDFDVPPGMKQNPKEIRGWWLGADSIYQNPRAGAIMAERLNAHLAPMSFVNLFSQVDLKYYFARKRQNLKEAYNYLDDDEIDNLMSQVPKLDFARELNADMMLTGRVLENHLSQNRTFHWWRSSVDVDCEMIDVITGQVVWRKRYRERDLFSSQFAIQEDIARLAAEDLREEFFRPLAVASAP